MSPLENYRYACKSLGCGKAGIPAGEQEGDGQDKPACEECGQVMTLRICPQCGFELEEEEMTRSQMRIFLLGSEGSGKSNFLAVLIDQLKGEMCKLYDATLYPTGGDRTMDYYEREYRRPLYEQGVCIPTTAQEDLNPLTYSLIFGDKDSEVGKSVGLTFYDSCGKNLESQQKMSAHSKGLSTARGIIFLIEPSQLPQIREVRKAKKQPVLDANPQALLLRTVHLLRTGLSLEGNEKIGIPIAVCLTKLDTLYPHLDPASFIGDPSRNLRKPMLSGSDISSCNMEVMALLESWGAGELVRHVQSQFADYSFFGLSALGASPGPQNEIERISPHRALDPLLWLLWRHKILKSG
ncbi:MAG: hypothetical protein FWE32_02940 [Oscillospiraceae bacterium]|nr:hypothetical protein [Oscillospiraceae bacterium]